MKKKNNSPYIILGVVIIVALSYYLYDRFAKKTGMPDAVPPQVQENQPQSQEAPPQAAEQAATSTPPAQPLAPSKQAQSTYSGSEEEELAPDILVEQVVFDGKGFSPAALNIKVGDIVIFKNSGSGSFWPASDPHPGHAAYPEFDAGKAVPAGGKFQFQFTQAGAFGYHDHLNPALKGTINVSAK